MDQVERSGNIFVWCNTHMYCVNKGLMYLTFKRITHICFNEGELFFCHSEHKQHHISRSAPHEINLHWSAASVSVCVSGSHPWSRVRRRRERHSRGKAVRKELRSVLHSVLWPHMLQIRYFKFSYSGLVQKSSYWYFLKFEYIHSSKKRNHGSMGVCNQTGQQVEQWLQFSPQCLLSPKRCPCSILDKMFRDTSL